jgi:hypothetical protein
MNYDKQREFSLGHSHYLYYEEDGGVAFREHGTGNLIRYLDETSLEYELAHKLRMSHVRPEATDRTYILLATEKGLTPVGKLVDALQAFVVAEDEWRETKGGMPEGTFDDALSDAYNKAKAALEQFTMYTDNIAMSEPQSRSEG